MAQKYLQAPYTGQNMGEYCRVDNLSSFAMIQPTLEEMV